MRRRTFDTLMTVAGLVVTLTLVFAGALLFVGYNFANGNVETQLSQQEIFFPKAGSDSLKDPRVGPYLSKYAGQKLVSGAQAEAYANHYIAVHISDIGKGTYYQGKTYAEMGALERANPKDTALKDARNTVFKGETLRGLLLNAYAFWKVGQIAKIAGIAAFAVAGIMGVLTILGFWHLRRVPVEEELLAPRIKMRHATA